MTESGTSGGMGYHRLGGRTGGGLFRMGRLVGFFLLLTLCVFGLLFYGMMNTSTELATLRTDFATLNAQSVKIKAELLDAKKRAEEVQAGMDKCRLKTEEQAAELTQLRAASDTAKAAQSTDAKAMTDRLLSAQRLLTTQTSQCALREAELKARISALETLQKMNAADAAAKNATSTATTPSVAGGTTPAPSAAPAAAINATVYTAPAGVLVSPRPKPAISENEANGAEKQSKEKDEQFSSAVGVPPPLNGGGGGSDNAREQLQQPPKEQRVAENPAEKGAAKKAENAAEKGVGKENLVEKGEEKKMKEKAKNTAAERVATEGESDNDDAVVFHRPPADAVSGSGGDAGDGQTFSAYRQPGGRVALEAHQQRIEAAETATGKNLGISDLLHAAAAANEQKAEKDKDPDQADPAVVPVPVVPNDDADTA